MRIAAVAALGLLLLGAAPAQTAFTRLALFEVEAFRHAFITDDVLLLGTYAAEGGEAGPDGLIAQLTDANDAVLVRMNPPLTGHALFALYLPPDTATWEGTYTASIIESPVLNTDPQEVTAGLTWRDADDTDAAAVVMASRLPALLQGLEREDPDIDAGAYVQGGLITIEGAALVQAAAPALLGRMPALFANTLLREARPEELPGAGTTIEDTGASSTVGVDLRALGRVVGMPAVGTGIILWAVLMLAVGALVYYLSYLRAVRPVLLAAPLIAFWVASLGLWPAVAVLALVAVQILVATSLLVTRLWPRG